MTQADENAALFPVLDVLEALEVLHYIGGSIASSIHGMARATADADVIADLKAEHVGEVFRFLVDRFYLSEEAMRDAVQRRGSFNLIHLDNQFKVDVFSPKDRAFDWFALRRRVYRPAPGGAERQLPLSSAEDTVLAKLEWYRLDNETSDRQWRDLMNVLKLNRGEIEREYLTHWASEIGVADLLVRAMAELAAYEAVDG